MFKQTSITALLANPAYLAEKRWIFVSSFCDSETFCVRSVPTRCFSVCPLLISQNWDLEREKVSQARLALLRLHPGFIPGRGICVLYLLPGGGFSSMMAFPAGETWRCFCHLDALYSENHGVVPCHDVAQNFYPVDTRAHLMKTVWASVVREGWGASCSRIELNLLPLNEVQIES